MKIKLKENKIRLKFNMKNKYKIKTLHNYDTNRLNEKQINHEVTL